MLLVKLTIMMHAENNNHVNETIYASYKADNTIVIVDISEKNFASAANLPAKVLFLE